MTKYNRDYMIRMEDIVREGDPILRVNTDLVSVPPTEQDQEEMACMLQFLKNSQDPEISKKYKLRAGIGLSANQIGLNKRMFAAYFADDKGVMREYCLFNPKIVSHSAAMTYLPESEGCLSVDRPIQGFVPRYEKIQIKAFSADGAELKLKFRGFASIVMQHELDHLNGVMFYDHINKSNPYKLPENVQIDSLY